MSSRRSYPYRCAMAGILVVILMARFVSAEEAPFSTPFPDSDSDLDPAVTPDFSEMVLKTPGLQDYNLGRALQKRLSILVVIPGGWDPHSVHALKVLRNYGGEWADRDFQIIVVAPERPRWMQELLDEYRLPFVLLSDPGHQVGRQLGIMKTIPEKRRKRMEEAGIDLLRRTGQNQEALPTLTFCFIGSDGNVHFLWQPEVPGEVVTAEAIRERAVKTKAQSRLP